MHSMDLRQLELFVAVAEEGTFTRAAARCHVVQSSLSYGIARLEQANGVALFERRPRAAVLTPAGEALLPHARRALDAVASAQAELASVRGVLTGTLRLGIIGAAETVQRRLDGALAAFHAEHPAVEIVIGDSGSTRMAEQVRGAELDVAFVGLFAHQVGPGLVHRLLASDPLVALVPSGHPLAGLGRVGLAELVAGSVAVELRPESGLRVQVDAAYARAGVQRAVAFELGALPDVIRLVRLGLGVAVVPRPSVPDEAGIVALELDDPDARHPVSLIHRDPAPGAPAARAFLAALDALDAFP
jgi:DNA-binding transcriptional LysR family regulator